MLTDCAQLKKPAAVFEPSSLERAIIHRLRFAPVSRKRWFSLNVNFAQRQQNTQGISHAIMMRSTRIGLFFYLSFLFVIQFS